MHEDDRVAEILERIVRLNEAWSKPEKAAMWGARLDGE